MSNIFDPYLIIYQIVALQCFFYLGLGLNLGIFHVIFESPLSLGQFFSPALYSFPNSTCVVIAGAMGAFLLSIIVERSKKCVDFTVTLYILHVLFCMYYDGNIPFIWEWWFSIVVSSVICASLGEFLCSRAEMEDIPLYVRDETSHERLIPSKSVSNSKLTARPHSPAGL